MFIMAVIILGKCMMTLWGKLAVFLTVHMGGSKKLGLPQ